MKKGISEKVTATTTGGFYVSVLHERKHSVAIDWHDLITHHYNWQLEAQKSWENALKSGKTVRSNHFHRSKTLIFIYLDVPVHFSFRTRPTFVISNKKRSDMLIESFKVRRNA